MTEKAALRKQMIKARSAIPSGERAESSRIICEKFLESSEYENAGIILLYKAYNSEVDTDLIFERALSDGKTVCYPRSAFTDGEPEMTFYAVNHQADLHPGYKGIPEPDTSKCTVMAEKKADVCITPGVAFDKMCHRIGYGMAFYDRYIRLHKPHKIIGLAYEEQIIDGFEPGARDMAADIVITQKNIYGK